MDLQCFVADVEPSRGDFIGDRIHHGGRRSFLDPVTTITNQEQQFMLVFEIAATDESVEAFDSMDKPLFEQEIQRAIHGSGLGGPIEGTKRLEKIIRLDRFMIAAYQLEYPATQRRKPYAALYAKPGRTFQRLVDAILVVVTVARVHVARMTRMQDFRTDAGIREAIAAPDTGFTVDEQDVPTDAAARQVVRMNRNAASLCRCRPVLRSYRPTMCTD